MNQYPKYKDSGIEWIGQVPEDWQIKKIKYLLKRKPGAIKTGPFGSQLKNSDLVDDGIKIYNQRSVIDNDFEAAELYISQNKFQELKEFEVFPNDLLLTTRGTIGRCAIFPENKERGILHPCLIRLQFNQDLIINEFARIYMEESPLFSESVKYNSNATTIAVIYGDTLKEVKLIVPDSMGQKRIIKYLKSKITEVDDLISKKQRMIELLKEQRAAVINEAVTKGLNPDVKMKDSGVEWIGKVPERWEVLPLYALLKERQNKNIGNIENNLLSLSYGKIIKKDINSDFGLLPESFENYNRIEQGDIVIRPTDLQNDKRSLRCGYVNEKGIITSAYLTLMTAGERKVNTKFMYYLLHDYDVMKVFYSLGGGVRQGLIFDDIKRMPILVPSYEEQNEIISFIDRKLEGIDRIIEKEQRNIPFLNEYRITLIAGVVTGKQTC